MLNKEDLRFEISWSLQIVNRSTRVYSRRLPEVFPKPARSFLMRYRDDLQTSPDTPLLTTMLLCVPEFLAWAEPDPKQHFSRFRVPFDYPAHSLQETVLRKGKGTYT